MLDKYKETIYTTIIYSGIYSDQVHIFRGLSWTKSIHKIIDNLGFSNCIENFENNCNYILLFKQRLRDQFVNRLNLYENSITIECIKTFLF
jgi:hypothetical protein